MENMELMSNRPNVLMFPWLAHGHVSSFLELAKKLSQRNFDISICSTPMILSLIKESHGKSNNLSSIKLIELNLPSNIPEFPPEYHTTKVLPRHLVPKLVEAFNMAATSFYDIIKIHNPDLLIYDHFQLWAPEIASLHNIPSVHFCVIGAVTMSFASHHVLFKDKSFPHPAIYLRDFEKKKQRIAMQSSIKLVDKEFPCGSMKRSCDIVLINSCREIEGKYIDYLSELSGKKVMPVGPLITEAKSDNNQGAENQEIMQWLDKKDKCSSVYVSFGTEYFLSKEEIEEIAHGLELSNVNFIWVLRFPVGVEMTIKEALPQGFLERVKERGMVMKWAPQDQILGHRNLGAFLSHCGWNSVLESIDFGVPVIAIPMHLDQPMHARMLVELGSAVEIERNDEGKLFGQNIAQVIRNVVVEKTGEELRNSVRNVREKIRIKVDEEIVEVVDEIYKLCMKSRKS